MQIIKWVLTFCSAAFAWILGCYCLIFIYAVGCRLFKGQHINWDTVLPWRKLKNDKPIHPFLVIVLTAGVVNCVLSMCLSSTEIGAFYEKSEYRETYEATLFIEEKPIFCLAEVQKYEGRYLIQNVLLPYGNHEYTDNEYDPEEGSARLSLGDSGWDCTIVLNDPATDMSYDMLNNVVVSNHGEFCGSKSSDIYHLLDCPHAKRINRENYTYFETRKEAEALGFVFCSDCNERY